MFFNFASYYMHSTYFNRREFIATQPIQISIYSFLSRLTLRCGTSSKHTIMAFIIIESETAPLYTPQQSDDPFANFYQRFKDAQDRTNQAEKDNKKVQRTSKQSAPAKNKE